MYTQIDHLSEIFCSDTSQSDSFIDIIICKKVSYRQQIIGQCPSRSNSLNICSGITTIFGPMRPTTYGQWAHWILQTRLFPTQVTMPNLSLLVKQKENTFGDPPNNGTSQGHSQGRSVPLTFYYWLQWTMRLPHTISERIDDISQKCCRGSYQRNFVMLFGIKNTRMMSVPCSEKFQISIFIHLCTLHNATTLTHSHIYLKAPCMLWGCKNRPSPFPGWMS